MAGKITIIHPIFGTNQIVDCDERETVRPGPALFPFLERASRDLHFQGCLALREIILSPPFVETPAQITATVRTTSRSLPQSAAHSVKTIEIIYVSHVYRQGVEFSANGKSLESYANRLKIATAAGAIC